MAGQKNLKKIDPLISLKHTSSLSGPNLCLMRQKVLRRSLQWVGGEGVGWGGCGEVVEGVGRRLGH